MISLTRNFVFVHVNKAGGTSVCEALAKHEDATAPRWDHAPARRWREWLGEALWGEMFSFAVVRNPYDRMVSSYEYRRQLLEDNPASTPAKERSFRDWMLEIVAAAPQNREWSDQLWMVEGAVGEVLVERIYLYERLAEGFADACSRIGIPVPPLGRYNRTERPPWRDYYDAETAAMVDKRFARDFAWQASAYPGLEWDRWAPVD